MHVGKTFPATREAWCNNSRNIAASLLRTAMCVPCIWLVAIWCTWNNNLLSVYSWTQDNDCSWKYKVFPVSDRNTVQWFSVVANCNLVAHLHINLIAIHDQDIFRKLAMKKDNSKALLKSLGLDCDGQLIEYLLPCSARVARSGSLIDGPWS